MPEYRSCDLGETCVLIWASQRARNSATVALFGSSALPFFCSVMSRAHSSCACRFVPVNECQRRLRLPVASSRIFKNDRPSVRALRSVDDAALHLPESFLCRRSTIVSPSALRRRGPRSRANDDGG